MFHEIGRGCCGSVWALPDADWVIKREDCDVNRSVLNDQIMHRRVLSADPHAKLLVQIPRSYNIIEADNSWWNENIDFFNSSPDQSLEPCRAYRQERIPAVPLSIREHLISAYCRPSLQVAARASKKNEDCLIRLYMGKRRPVNTAPRRFFSLRNYGLCIDQMEELGLDTILIAKVLAEALAHCYWKAGVDANDVEFVLAPSTGRPYGSFEITPVFKILGHELVIWMLDYDCVNEMSRDENGVVKAVYAFWTNDAYFPRPYFRGQTDDDRRLWNVFSTHFLEVSRAMSAQTGDGGRNHEVNELSRKWVERLEAEGMQRMCKSSEEYSLQTKLAK